MKALRSMWPQGWWPDQRTLGLLIFGFFGVAAFSVAVTAGSDLSMAFNLQGPNVVSYVPSWERITSGVILIGGIADLVAALGGLALMANLARARAVIVAALAVAVAAVVVTFVVAPIGFSVPTEFAPAILDLALVVFVIRWQPHHVSGARSTLPGTSTAGSGDGAR
jgi:hypothetical protein